MARLSLTYTFEIAVLARPHPDWLKNTSVKEANGVLYEVAPCNPDPPDSNRGRDSTQVIRVQFRSSWAVICRRVR